MNIHLPAILMWTTGVQGFDTLPYFIQISDFGISDMWGYPPGYPPELFNKITSITSIHGIHGGVGCCEAPLRRGFSSSDGRKLGPLAGVKVLDMTRVLAGPGSRRVNHRWICLSHIFFSWTWTSLLYITILHLHIWDFPWFPMDFPWISHGFPMISHGFPILWRFYCSRYRQDHAARRSWAIWAPRSSSWSDPKWATTPEALPHPSCQGPKRWTAGGRGGFHGLEDWRIA